MKKTKEASEMAGVSKRTLQYYDDIGLLRSQRDINNHRLYDDESLNRLWKIMVLKELGFELAEIKIFFERGKLDDMLSIKIKEINKKIISLNHQRQLISKVQKDGFPEKPNGSDSFIAYISQIIDKTQGV